MPKAMRPSARPKTSMKPMAALCYLCALWVRGPACLPLVASEREGLGPWGLPPVSVLRPVTRYARGAWGCVRCSTGRVGQRDSSSAGARRSVWRATRRAAFCRLTGFVDCGRVLLSASRRMFQTDLHTGVRPALWTAFEQQLCSGTL